MSDITPQEVKQTAEEAYIYAPGLPFDASALDGSWTPPSVVRIV